MSKGLTDKKLISDLLEEMATLLELSGANPFKSRAFRNASPIIKALPDDLKTRVEEGSLRSIKGIGEGISKVITDLVRTGRSEDIDVLRKEVPAGLLAMTTLRGLGPKRAKLLYTKLGIDSIESLEKACRENRLSEIDGFGKKSQEGILAAIAQSRTYVDQHLSSVARETSAAFLEVLRPLSARSLCEVAGSVRRRKEVSKDIDIVAACTAKSRARLLAAFAGHELVQEVIAQGTTKTTVRTIDGVLCDLRVVSVEEYPFALNYFTGSKEHNVAMRSLARKKGWSLNEYDFTPLPDRKGKVPLCGTEQEIYKALGLSYVEPELRENLGEIEAAAAGKLPTLITERDLKGTFHCHTTYSDGTSSLADMANAAKRKGWEYWGVADHSKAAAYARGLTHERVLEQKREVDKLNESEDPFRIFFGTECDIMSDGTLDFTGKTLKLFDYVVVSIHSKFTMTESEATKRVIRALKDPHTTILGHSTGRLLLEREGYPLDLKAVIDAASDYGKAIEINAHPRRLDLDWRWLRYAQEKRVPIAINPDAHSVKGLDDVVYGVGIARKGWLTSRDVVNAWGLQKVEQYFRKARG